MKTQTELTQEQIEFFEVLGKSIAEVIENFLEIAKEIAEEIAKIFYELVRYVASLWFIACEAYLIRKGIPRWIAKIIIWAVPVSYMVKVMIK